MYNFILQKGLVASMYTIGDKVVCPMHGAGIIEQIETRTINGEDQQYYVVSLFLGNIKIMVPVAKEATQMRTITQRDHAQQILDALHNLETEQNNNWSKRYRENMDKLKTGDLIETAKVFKSLVLRNKEKTLSAGERKMLHSARQILMSELMIALDTDITDLEREIFNAIG